MAYHINLLEKENQSAFITVLYFLTHSMRYFLVFSLLVVNVVFFARFLLDEQIKSLNDYKKGVEDQLNSKPVKELIARVDRFNYQQNQIEMILKNQESINTVLLTVQKNFPKDVKLDKFSYKINEFEIIGSGNDSKVIQQFVQKLNNSKSFAVVNLTSLERKGDSIMFSIKGTLNQTGKNL